MEADSAVRNDPDGGLRTSDVGKRIAVPGTTDLVATIDELLDCDVAHASMTAGSPDFSATFRGEMLDPWQGC